MKKIHPAALGGAILAVLLILGNGPMAALRENTLNPPDSSWALLRYDLAVSLLYIAGGAGLALLSCGEKSAFRLDAGRLIPGIVILGFVAAALSAMWLFQKTGLYLFIFGDIFGGGIWMILAGFLTTLGVYGQNK